MEVFGIHYSEWIGYAASVMVAISLMMKNIVWLRWLNMIGCSLFVWYGVMIEAWPVAGMNAFVAGINIYHLLKLRLQPEPESKPASSEH